MPGLNRKLNKGKYEQICESVRAIRLEVPVGDRFNGDSICKRQNSFNCERRFVMLSEIHTSVIRLLSHVGL